MRVNYVVAMGAVLTLAALVSAQPRGGRREESPVPQGQARDIDLRWRVPLAQKAEIIQRRVYEVNTASGTYKPGSPIPADGSPVTHTPLDPAGDHHTSSWTGSYLMGAAMRLHWARRYGTPEDVTAALDHGGKVLGGIYLLSHVSGKPGYLARYAALGHGPASEERGGNNERNDWWQGVGKYREYRFRGNPSHHNYHHILRGVAHWYYALTKDNPTPSARMRAQIDSTRNMYREMMEFAYKSNNLVLIDHDGTVAASIVSQTSPTHRPTTTSLMATNCLRFAMYILPNDPWYRQKYDALVQEYGYRNAKNVMTPDLWQGGRTPDYDDTEHVTGSLWLAHEIETDPEMKAFYRFAMEQIFASKRDKKRSPFNYFYAGVTGDRAGADLPGALETLRLYPTNTTYYPLMNSIRTDIDIAPNSDREGYGNTTGRPGSRTVLPFNEQPWDNAFTWKADPFRLDGYLARAITAFAVSQEDSVVWFLADAGGTLYRSLDGGRTFAVQTFLQGNARVNDVTFAGNKLRIVVLGTDKGIYWSHTGGYDNKWTHVPLGSAENDVRDVILDSANPNVVWAVADDGVWRSVDLGREEIGKAWQKVSGPMPDSTSILFKGLVYGVATGARPQVWAMLDGRIYRKAPGDLEWTISPVDQEGYHRIPDPRQIVPHPTDPNTALVVISITSWGNERTTLMRTTDGGKTFESIGGRGRGGSGQTGGAGLDGASLTSVSYDTRNPLIVYGASARGFFKSADGGANWQRMNEGLRIPLAYRVFAPKEIPGTLFVSTPAGFSASTDGGRTWNQPILVLNGGGVNRSELGGLGYIVAYWAGRGLGLISDEEAAMPPERWDGAARQTGR